MNRLRIYIKQGHTIPEKEKKSMFSYACIYKNQCTSGYSRRGRKENKEV